MSEEMKLTDDTRIIAEAARCAIAAAQHLIEVLHTVGRAVPCAPIAAVRGLTALPPHTVGSRVPRDRYTVGRVAPRPPQEPKEEKRKEEVRQEEEEKEKKATTTTREPAREIFDFAEKWNIPALFVQYWFMVLNGKTPENCERSLRSYWARAEKDKIWFKYKKDHTTPPKPVMKTYTKEDWLICQEQCTKCGDGCCLAGYKAPPYTEERGNHSPYYCPGYAEKEAAK